MSKKPTLAADLAKAAKGILLPSETDSTLEVVEFPGQAEAIANAAGFKKLVAVPPRTAVEKLDAEAFFGKYSTPRPDDDEGVKKMRVKFAKLSEWFSGHLEDVVVYRVGKISIRTYILGATSGGDAIGLVGTQVET